MSVVRYDDLGVSFAIPDTFRVMADAELEARIRSNASVKLQADLRKQAEAKKAIPLLVLFSRDAKPEELRGVGVTLVVMVVPVDTTPAELLTEQLHTMNENLKDVTSDGPQATSVDGVAGATLAARYQQLGHRSFSISRAFIRPRHDGGEGALAFMANAAWRDTTPVTEADVARVLDGLHFY